MASSKSLIAVVLFVTMVVAPLAEGAISCGQVVSALSPCLKYLTSVRAGAPVPAPCCSGIRSINSAAKTTPDRQQACTCIKNIAASASGINYAAASGLPGKCGVNIPYKISPSTDCKSVK